MGFKMCFTALALSGAWHCKEILQSKRCEDSKSIWIPSTPDIYQAVASAFYAPGNAANAASLLNVLTWQDSSELMN